MRLTLRLLFSSCFIIAPSFAATSVVADKSISDSSQTNIARTKVHDINALFTEDALTSIMNRKENKQHPIFAQDIFNELNMRMPDQEKALQVLARSINNHFLGLTPQKKTYARISGLTELRKNELISLIKSVFDMPTVVLDADLLGYYSSKPWSAQDLFKELYSKANYDKEKSQKGIVLIDGIEKLIASSSGYGSDNKKLLELIKSNSLRELQN